MQKEATYKELDYAPFGMQMPSRSFSGASGYKFGFNGMLKDDEIIGGDNSYTAPFWQYDNRLGRRWNIDPITYPWHGGYTTFNNNPIIFMDPLGLFAKKGKAERKHKKAVKKYGEDRVGSVVKKGDDYRFKIYEKDKSTQSSKTNNDGSVDVQAQRGTTISKNKHFKRYNTVNKVRSASSILNPSPIGNPFKRLQGNIEATDQLFSFFSFGYPNKNFSNYSPSSGYSYGLRRISPGVKEALANYMLTGEEIQEYRFSPNVKEGSQEFMNSLPRSFGLHLDILNRSDFANFTLGGYMVAITKTDNKDIVRMTVINEMSATSLLFHSGFFKDRPISPGLPLSTIKMKIDLGLIDLSK